MSELTPQALTRQLRLFPPARRYWVGYSGGRDSHVLLHCLQAAQSELGAQLCAVHVHHGLHAEADGWAEHCQRVCDALGIPCNVLRVDARPRPGQSPEAAARDARYTALTSLLSAGDALLTAHHRHDQAETVLLQLLRGAGPHGTAAMPAAAPLGEGVQLRPLLSFSGSALATYAQRHGLQWIEDHSNQDTGFDRNYVRHRLVPVLEERWPAWDATLARNAQLQAEAAQLADALASEDLLRVGGKQPNQLNLPALQSLEPARQRNVVRAWLRSLGLPTPTQEHLRHVFTDLIAARPDAQPLVRWHGIEVRRYRDYVYASAPLQEHDPHTCIPWSLDRPLELSALGMRLVAARQRGCGVRVADCSQSQTLVRFRCGGERLKPVGSVHRRTLKTLFQDHGVAPWQRSRLPLLYVGDRLAAVADLWVEDTLSAAGDEWGYTFSLTPIEPEYAPGLR